jgi:F0F1-type ATP synthase assembly protein I
LGAPLLEREFRSESAPRYESSMQLLVYILVICLVGVVLFWAIHKYEHDRRLAFFLELLVIGLGVAAILRQLLR